MINSVVTGAWRLLLIALGSIILVSGHVARADETRSYRLAGPDVASELVLRTDGSFSYFLSAGSLDEHAEGTWEQKGSHLQLATVPRPVAAVFSAGPFASTKDAAMTLHVVDPDGHDIALVNFELGFDTGAPLEGYTQYDGWTLDKAESRTLRWIELSVPIYDLKAQRFPIDLTQGNALTFVLHPNDLGAIDFSGVEIDIEADRLVMHRNGYSLEFCAHKSAR